MRQPNTRFTLPRSPFPLEETLFLSDLDGTLLGPAAQLTEPTRRVLPRLLQDSRLHLSIATAREYYAIQLVLPSIDFPLPLVAGNGSFLIDTQQRKQIEVELLEPADLLCLRPILDSAPITPFFFCTENGREETYWVGDPKSEGAKFFLSTRSEDGYLQSLPPEQADSIWQKPIFCINIMDEVERLRPLYETIRAMDQYYVIFQEELYHDSWWLSIYPKQVNKGRMGRKLADRLGLRYLVALGDASNDLPLFEEADAAYAMQNADPVLQAVATATLPYSNAEDGVLRFLLHQIGETL